MMPWQQVVANLVRFQPAMLWLGNRFINENVLPIWFDHFATHDPGVWTKYGIAQQVDL